MNKLLLSLFFTLILLTSNAQEMSITGADITQCGGFLVDDGMSAGDYSNNLNATITVCVPDPETILNLYFAVCDLGNGDYLEIFDGPNTGSTLIGTYYSNDLQTTDITSTNASGCLTVHFFSDNFDVGNFAAEIGCGPPCERPFAVVNTNQNPIPVLLCPGEDLTFNGSASTFAAGATLASWEWIFDDGTTNTTSWPSVTHHWDTPGGYKVELMLTDDNDCHNNNLIDYIVYVSTSPDLSLLSPEFDLCQGGLQCMGVNFFIPDSIYGQDSLNTWITEPWIDLPHADLGGYLYIPDDQTNCFSDELTFTNFDFGATIDNISDMDNFYINFEHSFMGDITITFICPNGQSIAVHQQGGGGEFLGEPIDGGIETTGENPGVGYDYYWAPDATAGTWEEEAALNSGTLPAGTYQSVQPWDVLIGCPLNGTWTVEICDSWAADDGYIFDWGMAFNPQLYGDLMQFTPIYGAGCDSSWWEGPNIVNTELGCDFICIEINETGIYDYTYTVINNFGCTFDTTISVEVYIASMVTAGPDMLFNCDPIMLQGGLDGGLVADCSAASGNYEQCFGNNENWIETYCPNNPGDGVTYLTIDFNAGTLESGFDELYVYDGPSTGSSILAGPLTGDFTGLSYAATNSEGCLTLSVQSDGSSSCVDGSAIALNYDISCGEAQVPFEWLWTPATGLSDPTIPNPIMENVGSDMTYTLTGYPVGYPGCGSQDEMHVTLDPSLPNPGIDTQMGICPEGAQINMFTELDGNPDSGGSWTTEAGMPIAGVFNPATDTPGNFYYTIVIDDCSLTTELQIDIQYPEIGVDADTTICINGMASLHTWSETDFDNTYQYHWSTNATSQVINVQPGVSADYWVYANDVSDCVSDTAWVSVDYRAPLVVTAMNDTTICVGATLFAHTVQHTGGLAPYTYTWTFNGSGIGGGEGLNHSPNVEGEYCVTLSDACETTPVQDCALGHIQIPVPITIASDTTNGCSPLVSNISITTPGNLYNQSEWTIEDGTSYAMVDDLEHTITIPGTYDLTVTLTTMSGCEFVQTFPDYLTVYPDPTAGWVADPQPTTIENALIQFTDMSSGTGLHYHWIFNTDDPLGTSYEQNPTFQFPAGQGGEYNVRLLISDQHHCTDMIEGLIDINDILTVYIPNSVTPNNDGVNDVVFVEGADIDPNDFSWVIFNRWGDVVYQSADPTRPWTCGRGGDGEYYVQDGVYNYVVKAKSESTGAAKEITGFVTVIR